MKRRGKMKKKKLQQTASLALVFSFLFIGNGSAKISEKVLKSMTTPNNVETIMGKLQFNDGYPTTQTAAKIRDELDYINGINTFMNSTKGVSVYAIRKGLLDVGVNDNDILLFSNLMDSNSLFLTGNADTVYYMTFLDLSKEPMVFEAPPEALGLINDMWFRYVTDFGIGGAERGKGGKYLLVGPGYTGPLPKDEFIVRKSRTSRVLVVGRHFIANNNDPKPTVSMIKNTLKIYPYKNGGIGTSIASFLLGKTKTLSTPAKPKTPRFVEGSGKEINTIYPNDYSYFKMLNELVQMEPAEALDPELAGQFAAIGIVKDKEFAPDERLRKILEKAVAFANAASRTLGMGAHPTDNFRFYEKTSAWWNMLFEGGYDFINPPPMIVKNSVKPFPNSGSRKINARTAMFYSATGITPLMCMRLTNAGSQYLLANTDSTNKPFDGSRIYKVDLPKNIPAARFWSITLYDNQTRSMLQTPQRYPRAGSQSYPSPAAKPNRNGSITIYFGPDQPEDAQDGNWIQTDPKKGWFACLRLYSPLQSFFDKTW
ncbi:DUF1254 domain-containing protein, partial [Candidatus Dependentiae bacterium]